MENTNYIKLSFLNHNSKLNNILIDHDYTLYNFGLCRESIMTELFEKYSFDRDIYLQLYNESKYDKVYKRDEHIIKIAKIICQWDDVAFAESKFKDKVVYNSKYLKLLEEISQIFNIHTLNSSNFYYDDVKTFLDDNISKYNIYVFSLGYEEFQKQNILNSGLTKYLTGAIYCKEPKSKVMIDNMGKNEVFLDNTIIIDDRPIIWNELSQIFIDTHKLQCIRLKRYQGKYINELDEKNTKVIDRLII